MHICFLSNGYGEDRAAAVIADRLRAICPWVKITGAPLVTSGEEFTTRGFPVLVRGKVPPSGGFPLKSVKGFVQDAFYTPRYFRYYERLKSLRSQVDHAVVVGDVAMLTIAHLAFGNAPIFVELAKSSYKGSHFRFEEHLLRTIPSEVITRDLITCEYLRSRGVSSVYLGNPMMDGLRPRGLDLGSRPIIGILPGSRGEACENMRTILRVVERVAEDVTFACALSAYVPLDSFARGVRPDGWEFDGKALTKHDNRVLIFRDGFADVIAQSWVVIGMAGTANEQAAGIGTPVVSLSGSGAQTTVRRMMAQQRLLGDSVSLVRRVPDGAVAEISTLLSDPDERARRGRIGMERMGPPGASSAIAEFLVEKLGLPLKAEKVA